MLDRETHCVLQELSWPGHNIKLDPKIIEFIRELVEDILADKKSKQLVFPDEACTAPKNQEELTELITSSFERINQTWEQIFWQLGKVYIPPKLVLFDWKTSESGMEISRAMGPCYVPRLQKIFMDPSFFEYFRNSFYPWTEDFTMFYILAHEVAHHVQDTLFDSIQVSYPHEWDMYERELYSALDLRNFSLYHHSDSRHQAEQIVEIHADFLTWVVTHHANKNTPFLHENDISEWIETAIAIWDDIIQFRKKWEVQYEKFNHGRCDQRALAFANWLKFWNVHRFSLADLARFFIEQWANTPAEETIEMFNKLARKVS